jgi:5-methylcytosine-specific restriction enzyme subunit McrC
MGGGTPRTLFLTERIPALCRLHPADVAFLAGHHATHVELVPAGRRHVYRLTPRGRVGVLVAPRCRLVIRPKIPLDNLFFLLDPTAPVPAAPDRAAGMPGHEVLDFLAGQLAGRLALAAAGGLHRGYREQAEQGPFLHGPLDLASQLRQAPARKDQLHCRVDDFTADVPCNQVLRATVERLLASPLPGEGVRALLRAALARLQGVQALVPSQEQWQRLRAGRLPQGYGLLLDLCGLLLEGLAPGVAAGPLPAPAFLLDLERAWERHVSRAAVDAFAGTACLVSVQQTREVARDGSGRPLVMRPDVAVGRDGRTLLVIDAKWKRTRDRAAATDDLYQVLAYAAALGAAAAVLVYPGRRDRSREYRWAHTPVRLEVRTLRVRGTRAECAESARRLGRALTGRCQRL